MHSMNSDCELAVRTTRTDLASVVLGSCLAIAVTACGGEPKKHDRDFSFTEKSACQFFGDESAMMIGRLQSAETATEQVICSTLEDLTYTTTTKLHQFSGYATAVFAACPLEEKTCLLWQHAISEFAYIAHDLNYAYRLSKSEPACNVSVVRSAILGAKVRVSDVVASLTSACARQSP